MRIGLFLGSFSLNQTARFSFLIRKTGLLYIQIYGILRGITKAGKC